LEIELILKRESVLQTNPEPKKEVEAPVLKGSSSLALFTENYYNKYEAFKMTLSIVQFKYKKCVMINILPINDEKARSRLLC
jgi:hypothetical protein